jgi:integrase
VLALPRSTFLRGRQRRPTWPVRLDTWLAGKKLRLKRDTYLSYVEACDLYFKPGVGHLRLVELRDRHLQDLVTAMIQVNQPLPDGEKPSETLHRLIAVRADDTRKMLLGGETRHKKSTKPLSPARIEREFAVIRAALNDAIPSKLLINPFDGVVLPRVDKAKPLVWTPAREARFRDELTKRLATAEAAAADEDRVLTTVERQALWAAKDLRPVPSMVWMPAHAGEFADYLDRTRERLAVLFIVAMYTGMRRDELLGLTWSEIDLDQGAAFVLETASGDGPKSEAGTRVCRCRRPRSQRSAAGARCKQPTALLGDRTGPAPTASSPGRTARKYPASGRALGSRSSPSARVCPRCASTTCATARRASSRPPALTRRSSRRSSATRGATSPTVSTSRSSPRLLPLPQPQRTHSSPGRCPRPSEKAVQSDHRRLPWRDHGVAVPNTFPADGSTGFRPSQHV